MSPIIESKPHFQIGASERPWPLSRLDSMSWIDFIEMAECAHSIFGRPGIALGYSSQSRRDGVTPCLTIADRFRASIRKNLRGGGSGSSKRTKTR